MPTPDTPAAEIWTKTVDRVKDRVNKRSLWETMEKAVGIAVEDGTLIVGLNSRVFNEAGHMSTSENRNAIEQAASALAGTPLRLRVIEGETIVDWANTKQREERVAALRDATYEQRDRRQAEAQNWEALYELAAKAYSTVPMRQLPQAKARYLRDMLAALADAMPELYPAEPDETTERLLARVIDRIAHYADVPPPLVALELDRIRAARN